MMGAQLISWSSAHTELEPPQFSEGDDVLASRAADAAEEPEATPSPASCMVILFVPRAWRLAASIVIEQRVTASAAGLLTDVTTFRA